MTMAVDSENVFQKMFDNPPPKPGLPDETKFPRIVSARIPCSQEDLDAHLRKYVQTLLDEGADEARIIRAKDIPQDPRVILKCSHPKCPAYGRSGSCPPHVTGDFQKAKEFLHAYDWAIVYRVNIPKNGLRYLTSPSRIEAMRSKELRHASGSMQRYVYGIGDKIERDAFYDGHYFVVNCHFGPCMNEHCEEFTDCQEMKVGHCRFPHKAKPSVEQTFAVDFLKLASQLGWEYYMLGPCAFPQDYPQDYQPYFIGLVMIT
jgi:predicted metal-binding protein